MGLTRLQSAGLIGINDKSPSNLKNQDYLGVKN